jgi:hypothetical protein
LAVHEYVWPGEVWQLLTVIVAVPRIPDEDAVTASFP